MKPVCVGCKVEMRVESMGVSVIEMAGGKPYRIWSADLFKCGPCGVEIASGYGQFPAAEHFDQDFEDSLRRAKGGRCFQANEHFQKEIA